MAQLACQFSQGSGGVLGIAICQHILCLGGEGGERVSVFEQFQTTKPSSKPTIKPVSKYQLLFDLVSSILQLPVLINLGVNLG